MTEGNFHPSPQDTGVPSRDRDVSAERRTAVIGLTSAADRILRGVQPVVSGDATKYSLMADMPGVQLTRTSSGDNRASYELARTNYDRGSVDHYRWSYGGDGVVRERTEPAAEQPAPRNLELSEIASLRDELPVIFPNPDQPQERRGAGTRIAARVKKAVLGGIRRRSR